MDYELANTYADQIRQGNHPELYSELVKMCLPYLLYLRKKRGFLSIPVSDIRNELATDAVTDAILAQSNRGLPFTICLHNCFRDCCRKRQQIIRDGKLKDIVVKLNLHSPTLGTPSEAPSAEHQIFIDEYMEQVKIVLERHEPFSKKVVFQKYLGSPYQELAEIFNTTIKECKRIFCHDFYYLRKEIKDN